ncbi:hypothetical protein QBC39DRAFT_433989 [Podospora conica]|nr:hypothetical protein QBC39DRAFT_433989 [Schizothecium conicum]
MNTGNPDAVPAPVVAMNVSTKIFPGDNPEERPVEHSLSAVAEWLASDGTTPEPVVQCPICYAEISIDGLSPLNPDDEADLDKTAAAADTAATAVSAAAAATADPESDKYSPSGVALTCSHILCSTCARNTYRFHGSGCPLCRQRTLGVRCGHLVTTALPVRGGANIELTVGGLAEYLHGGLDEKPDWCRRCVAKGHASWTVTWEAGPTTGNPWVLWTEDATSSPVALTREEALGVLEERGLSESDRSVLAVLSAQEAVEFFRFVDRGDIDAASNGRRGVVTRTGAGPWFYVSYEDGSGEEETVSPVAEGEALTSRPPPPPRHRAVVRQGGVAFPIRSEDDSDYSDYYSEYSGSSIRYESDEEQDYELDY